MRKAMYAIFGLVILTFIGVIVGGFVVYRRLPPNYTQVVNSSEGTFVYYHQRRTTNPSGMCAILEGPGPHSVDGRSWFVDLASDNPQQHQTSSLMDAMTLAEKHCPTHR